MTPEEIAESAHAFIAASGSPLKAIQNLRTLQARKEELGIDADGIRDLDELILFTRNVREAQIEAGLIFKRARAARKAKA